MSKNSNGGELALFEILIIIQLNKITKLELGSSADVYPLRPDTQSFTPIITR